MIRDNYTVRNEQAKGHMNEIQTLQIRKKQPPVLWLAIAIFVRK